MKPDAESEFNLMKSRVETHAGKQEVIEAAGRALNEVLLREPERPILFLTAAGSALALLDAVRTEALGSGLTIGVSDERFDTDPKINNFAQMAATPFFKRAEAAGSGFINTRPMPGETLHLMGKRFDQELKEWRRKNPEGRIVMTQGIGPDGHTAGVMPFPENPELFHDLFEDESRWAVGYDATGKNEYPSRVTVTLPFLRNEVDETILYVVGDNKREPLQKALSQEGSLNEIPAAILSEMKKANVFTDINL